MNLFGACPHCGARVELAPLEFAGRARCRACLGYYLAVLPEPGTEPAQESVTELEVLLLPHGFGGDEPETGAATDSERARGGWLASRGLLRPRSLWMITAAIAGVLLVVLGIFAATLPASQSKHDIALVLVGLLLLVAMPLTSLFAALVVRLLFGQRSGDKRAFWHSVTAVTLGVTALAVGVFLWPLALSPLGVKGRTALLLVLVLTGIPPGWLTVRLARGEPYRHALAVALTFVLGPTLLMLPFGWRAVAAALFFSIYLPFVFFGAWMRVHFRAAGTA